MSAGRLCEVAAMVAPLGLDPGLDPYWASSQGPAQTGPRAVPGLVQQRVPCRCEGAVVACQIPVNAPEGRLEVLLRGPQTTTAGQVVAAAAAAEARSCRGDRVRVDAAKYAGADGT
ncbi:hypothetical protein Vafri_14964, partial [Volvox africanus]